MYISFCLWMPQDIKIVVYDRTYRSVYVNL